MRSAPITVQNVVTYDVVVRVDNPELKLKPGMTANVSIVLADKEGVLQVPNAALRFRLPESESAGRTVSPRRKTPGVWVLEKEKPKRVALTTGISDGTYTEILSGNLREGEKVIVESAATKKKNSASSSSRGPRMF